MKVSHIINSDSGGAGRAAYRLHQGLKSLGVDSKMLVQFKASDDRAVFEPDKTLDKALIKLKISERLDALPLQFYRGREGTNFSLQWLPDGMASKVSQLNPDVVNLHWVCHGYLQIESLAKFNKPIVWTLHDLWPFTGGCHYPQDCQRYTDSCGACPQLGSSKDWDLSRWVWQRKAKAWKNLNLTLVSPSSWMAECAKSSSLFKDFRVEVIPHGMDTQKYKPIDRQVARSLLNLPQDKQLVLFGAIYTSEPRKGFQLLEPALQSLSKSGWKDRIELAIFGSSQPENPIDTGFKYHYLGRFEDDISLAAVYSAADVMVVPSIQESFGQTAFEALACGTPVVAFNATGLKDIVEHRQTGYLARPYEIEDLALGIAWVLENPDRHQKLSQRARQKAEQEFTVELQARRYLSLFTELLSPANSPAPK
ncbi:MAG: glycosyltransferase family 4 protein [Oscillatoria princeps RMCB-10]|jgi:glycosyltransferase involved in cell wall biosynthesis|nr:glycosyltransferase family 4 protein [Oscillatoria princeps RMCB-10]